MNLIEFQGLTKLYGRVTAVDDLSATVVPGRVTAFLGPNGAGKSTAFRLLLGLARPTRGRALIGGREYAALRSPRHEVGAVLGSETFHPGRRGRDHLRVLGRASGIQDERVDELLDLVGLTADGHRRVRVYSLGMRQRLALASALLGDPGVLVLDEPANGLDPEGIAWLRRTLRSLAADGRTVLMSSHLLSEADRTAADVLVVGGGSLRYAGPLDGLTGPGVSLEDAFLDLTTEAAS